MLSADSNDLLVETDSLIYNSKNHVNVTVQNELIQNQISFFCFQVREALDPLFLD